MKTALKSPQIDPTPIFEHFRGSYATELLTAAVAHLGVFEILTNGGRPATELREAIGLAERPFVVLTTALRAMGLIACDANGLMCATPMASEHLRVGGEFDISEYIRLAAESPGVATMVKCLKTNRPMGAEEPPKQRNASTAMGSQAVASQDAVAPRGSSEGTAFIYREGVESAMEHEASARRLTLALAGRAKNVAPVLAKNVSLSGAKHLLDLGGGTGIYSVALLQANPTLTATVYDRPKVLKVAAEFAEEYGVADRLSCVAGDMFRDSLPSADAVLLSNVLHDWDVPECRRLIERSTAALASGGRVLIHDVYLNDTLDGPLPIALYSAALFSLTEGRAYSAAEYRTWLTEYRLNPQPIVPTLCHCGVLAGVK